MMPVTFDLISDLHIDTWPGVFDWKHQPTSPLCVVAGDVSRDRQTLIETLTHLGECYQAVFYIDGNDEHFDQYSNLSRSYSDLIKQIRSIPKVVFLQDNVVILDNVAFLGTNGWWSYDFDDKQDLDQCRDWWATKMQVSDRDARMVAELSQKDSLYLYRSFTRLQHEDVEHIVVVTHTVPYHLLIAHDIELCDQPRFNVMGNNSLLSAAQADVMGKIHTWCFGHYHSGVDQIHHDIRFVNNCRGRNQTKYRQAVYHPLRIVIDG